MQKLDAEWMELIIAAIELGLTKKDVKGFLNKEVHKKSSPAMVVTPKS
ncbi:anti-repressor SinI family protein [Virgibacillus halophilus]|uniref:Anti-repressor SinI family protein n=1 Tax=Tigheibacillus halophilus TaxID=361280 RepID=A0ABU5CA74_9BACI|nr:anti-repressor SinI family protein [Virgibacillus halophilus]